MPVPNEKPLRRNPFAFWVGAVTMSFIILIPSAIGFGTKLYELFVLGKSNAEGGFALMPICNYTLATTGFGFLMIWAAFNGMFRDIERPKFEFFDREQLLDRKYATATPEE